MDGVSVAEVNYATEGCSVEFDEKKVNSEKIAKVVEDTGYSLVDEELLFAASFGFIWSSIYEHIMWRKII